MTLGHTTLRASQGRCERGQHCDNSVESRFEALHASGLTELVGREEELGLFCGAGQGEDRRRSSRVALR